MEDLRQQLQSHSRTQAKCCWALTPGANNPGLLPDLSLLAACGVQLTPPQPGANNNMCLWKLNHRLPGENYNSTHQKSGECKHKD